jgi:hypothetical protein
VHLGRLRQARHPVSLQRCGRSHGGTSKASATPAAHEACDFPRARSRGDPGPGIAPDATNARPTPARGGAGI